MPDRFDDGREGLSGAEPTRDLWAEAHGRALHETVPLSTVPEAKSRHPGRWLAAAAVVALIVGVGLAVVTDDDPGVTVGPDTSTALTAPSPTYGAGTMCPFTLTGDPMQLRTGHVSGEAFDHADPDLPLDDLPTVMHGNLGDQPMEVSIPGQVVTDLVGERVEDIELARGTAQIWFSDGFAQVRWFPGKTGPCESFTVAVFGPDDDFNRHAAVDFADRLVLPEAAVAPRTSVVGTWHLATSTDDGATTPAHGEEFAFGADDVVFPLGCNGAHASYSDDEPGVLRFGPAQTTLKGCPDDPTATAVAHVMAGGPDQPVMWTIANGSLLLQVDGASLLLDPGEPNGSTPTTTGTTAATATSSVETSDVDPATWPIQGEWAIYSVASADADPGYPDGLEATFDGASVTWDDYCRTETGSIERIDGDSFRATYSPTYPGFGCTANDDSSLIAKVMYADPITARLEGAAGSIYLTLTAPSGDQLVLRRTNDGSSPSGEHPLG